MNENFNNLEDFFTTLGDYECVNHIAPSSPFTPNLIFDSASPNTLEDLSSPVSVFENNFHSPQPSQHKKDALAQFRNLQQEMITPQLIHKGDNHEPVSISKLSPQKIINKTSKAQKNREYLVNWRLKKKSEFQSLKKQVELLTKKNLDLTTQLQRVYAENFALQNTVCRLTNGLQQ